MQLPTLSALVLALSWTVIGAEDYHELTRKVEKLMEEARGYTFPVNNERFYQRNEYSDEPCGKW